MVKGSIYIIKNYINDKVYIGQTIIPIHERFMQHMKPSIVKKNYKFYKAIRKYGKENFYIEILEQNINIELLDEKEIYYIEKFNSYKYGYNSTPGGDGRIINKVENEEEILNLAKSGLNSLEIAEKFNVSNATIFRVLKKYNFNYINLIPKELFVECLNKKMSNYEMADFFNVNLKTVSRYLNRYGLNKYNKKVNYRNDFNIEQFKKDYINGMSIKEMEEKYKMNKSPIYKLAKRLNIKRKCND